MKKSKAMREEELEQKRSEINDLKKELETFHKREQYEQFATEIKAAHDSLIETSVDDAQALHC